MTNATNTLTGKIENVKRFRKFAIVMSDDGQHTAILYRDVLEAAGFLRGQLTETSQLVLEVIDASRGLKATKVISVDGVTASDQVERQAAEADKPKRSLKKRPHKAEPQPAVSPIPFTLKPGERATGRLKDNFDPERGFGFIRVTSCTHRDVFVHIRNIPEKIYQDVKDGREVVFSVGSEERNGETRFYAEIIDLVATLAAEAAA